MAEVTFKNICSFIEGHLTYIYAELVGLPNHLQEQIEYRVFKCKDDCLKTGKCIKCGCTANKKILVNASCNDGERFPNLMNEEAWEKFKKDNNGK